MPPKPWKTLSSRLVYQNPWARVREDVAEMPNGRTTIYGVVECNGAVGVLPFIDEQHVLMVRQYRYVFDENYRWEMPTGGIQPGEDLLDAAHRELKEEVGHDARELIPISTFYSSKSIVHEVAHLYLGRGLTKVHAVPDETEFLEVATLPFDEVLTLVLENEIRDAMTVVAVLKAARLLGK